MFSVSESVSGRATQTMSQRFTFDKLSRDDVRAGSLANLVDRDDVWMIQSRTQRELPVRSVAVDLRR